MKVKAKDIIHQHVFDEQDNQNLTIGKVYTVIGIEGDYYRVVNDIEEPIIYLKDLFEIVDSEVPNDWTQTVFDGETYIEPPETSVPGFYEDYFDGLPEARKIYSEFLIKIGVKST